MNYYQHHIGDFMRDTAYLSATEEGIYRRALDWYYANEKPLPEDIKLVCRYLRARDKVEIAAVNAILSEFFVLTESGYHQSRCDKEIATYSGKAETNRVNGAKGGRPKKGTKQNPQETQTVISGLISETQTVISGLISETQTKGNQEPITINQEPITINQEPINTHTQSAGEQFSPNLEKLNNMLKASGSKPLDQDQLNQVLVTFNPYYELHTLTENQRYGKLVTWLKRDNLEIKTRLSKSTQGHHQPRLDVNAAWEQEPKNDQPVSLEDQERFRRELESDKGVAY